MEGQRKGMPEIEILGLSERVVDIPKLLLRKL
jgi:hypothetical protein